jgi:hypothetical protein
LQRDFHGVIVGGLDRGPSYPLVLETDPGKHPCFQSLPRHVINGINDQPFIDKTSLYPFYRVTLVSGQKAENPFPGMSISAFKLIGKITFFKHFTTAKC